MLLLIHRQESLRFYPIAYFMLREAENDDDIPLSKPVTTTTGQVLHSIPVQKGQKILTSIVGYNKCGFY